jgi:SAM-dependent methyltransferase
VADLARDRQQEAIWSYYQGEGADAFGRAGPRLDHLARRLQSRVASGRVLTVGVGNGHLERRVAALGYRHVGLDPDVDAISRLGEDQLIGVPGVLEALPFATDSFDAVVASEVLEHLDEGAGAASLLEIQRVLRPAGWFLGTVPFAEELQDAVVMCPCCGERFHRWGHRRSFDRRVLSSELEQSFDVERLDVRAFPQLRGRGVGGFVKGSARWVLGRRGVALSSPCLVFEGRRRPLVQS